MKALVIGYGSIGQRHTRLLSELGCDVAVVSRRSIAFSPLYEDLSAALKNWQPDYVVVANRTNEHCQSVRDLILAGYQGRVLVEKPLFSQYEDSLVHNFSHCAVAYNLRFHPLLQKLKSLLAKAKSLVCAHVYVGSYLPDWRPQVDYRECYSAKSIEGGGVLRDLSHELDYVMWMLGPWQRLVAWGGHLSSLDIDSDDAYSMVMEYESCPLVTLHMNYLDHAARREISVTSDQHTIRVDLIKNELEMNGVVETCDLGRDDTYRLQHEAMLQQNFADACTFDQGMETLFTINRIEKSSQLRSWVER